MVGGIVGAGLGSIQPGQLSEALDEPANTLSFHPQELRQAFFVRVQGEGRFLQYRADPIAVRDLEDFLTAHCCQGVPCRRVLHVSCEEGRCSIAST